MAWGVETLTVPQRYAKAIAAGIDQFGGVADSEVIVQLVSDGMIPEDRIDASATRILVQKFALGLFENPYVDADAASGVAGRPEFARAALDAQERSMVLLSNQKSILPLKSDGKTKVFLVGFNPEAAKRAGLTPVQSRSEPDVALIRLNAP